MIIVYGRHLATLPPCPRTPRPRRWPNWRGQSESDGVSLEPCLPLGARRAVAAMSIPSAGDVERTYPQADWCRDMEFWAAKGKLLAADHPQMLAYYRKEQAANPCRDENCARMWMALAFTQSYLPELVRAGAATQGPKAISLPQSLVSALYRAFMSPAAASNPRGVTVPLILEVIKDQKEWNEDRT
jgi:hypothetical protein